MVKFSMVLKVIFFVSFVIQSAYSGDTRLGIQYIRDYSGPDDSYVQFDKYKNQLYFVDNKERDIIFDDYLSFQLFSLNTYMQAEYKYGVLCPDSDYIKLKDDLKYFVRLLSMSYLFEALREYQYTTKKLELPKTCEMNWRKFLDLCRPKSTRFKSFLEYSKVFTRDLGEIQISIDDFDKKFKTNWIDGLSQNRTTDLLGKQILSRCEQEACKFNKVSIESQVRKQCADDQELLMQICSEEDQLHGISYSRIIYPLLTRSHVFNEFYDSDITDGCLRRYIDENSKFEKKYESLIPIYQYFYSRFLNESDRRYERGRLFSLGTLYRFHEKGLKKIIQEEVVEVKKISKQIDKDIEKPTFTPIELPSLPKKKKIKKEKKVVIKKVEPKIEIKKSAFFQAVRLREETKANSVDVNMNNFSYDFVFTEQEKEKMSGIVEHFGRQKSLKDMLKYDKLGTLKSPVPLRFIKFLIDENNHQYLYNIIFVLGTTFYISNDLDKNTHQVALTSLKNNQDTNYKWQLTILNPNTTLLDK